MILILTLFCINSSFEINVVIPVHKRYKFSFQLHRFEDFLFVTMRILSLGKMMTLVNNFSILWVKMPTWFFFKHYILIINICTVIFQYLNFKNTHTHKFIFLLCCIERSNFIDKFRDFGIKCITCKVYEYVFQFRVRGELGIWNNWISD